jgi:exodeoxyribonuclease V beta subunit
MDFDDLLAGLHDALQAPGGARLARIIREQFPVALIDEFQDTDPLQYAIFGKVYLNRPQIGLFMIGDPKQAIFAFRGADIHTYMSARRDTSEDRRYTLGRNYRSTDGLVQSVNRMFSVAAAHPRGAFLFDERIPFENVDAQGRAARFTVNGVAAHSMHLWYLRQTEPLSKTVEGGYLDRMAESFAGAVARLLNLAQHQPPLAGFQKPGAELEPLRPADIAILVRDGHEAVAMRRALDRRRVRSVYLSDKDSVLRSPEAVEVLFLMRGCAEPRQAGILRAALATRILALSLAQLDRLNRDGSAWEMEVERFSRYHWIWRHQGVLPMLRTLLHEFGVATRLLAETGGERSLTNLLHLAELLQIQANELDGTPGLIRWLAEQVRRTSGGVDEQILRLESDEALVRVVTIHKSKGLEYPLVFLPFICSFREVTRANFGMAAVHHLRSPMEMVTDPTEQDIQAADDERLAEDLRLLYVAVTRARFACWLGIAVMGRTMASGETTTLHLSAPGYLLSGQKMIPTRALVEHLAQLKGTCAHIAVAPLPDPGTDIYSPPDADRMLSQALVFNGRVPCDWRVSSYSGLMAGARLPAAFPGAAEDRGAQFDAPHSAVEDQLQEFETYPLSGTAAATGAHSIHRFPRGPQPGTFLHGLLEWVADEGFDTLAHAGRLLDDKIGLLCSARGWQEWAGMLTDWLHRLLHTPLSLPDDRRPLTLAALKTGDYQAEMEFLFAAHQVAAQELDACITAGILKGAGRPRLQAIQLNGMLKGFIDLVVCHGGRYYVMDYKSNYLGEDRHAYGGDAMAAAILEHRYDLQYVLYTLALHRLLAARLPDYHYRRDVGGVLYLFLRGVDAQGQGLYVDKPPEALIVHLDACFSGRGSTHAA